MNFIYRVLYHPSVNRLLIHLVRYCKQLIPEQFWLHPTGQLKLPLPNQQNIQLYTNQTSFLTKELFYKGCLSFEYTPFFIKLITKVDVFFDIGSNMGYYSILGVHYQPKLQVHAFEPAEGPYTYLKKNILLNKAEKNIASHQLALSNNKGTATFYLLNNPKYPGVYNLSGEHNLQTKAHLRHQEIKVQTNTLDNFIIENKINQIDLIKIDTEGNEHHILAHALDSIAKFQPIIICEVLYNTIEKELDVLVKKMNYHIYHVTNKRLQKTTTLQRNEDNGIRNCFFVPTSKIHLIESLQD